MVPCQGEADNDTTDDPAVRSALLRVAPARADGLGTSDAWRPFHKRIFRIGSGGAPCCYISEHTIPQQVTGKGTGSEAHLKLKRN